MDSYTVEFNTTFQNTSFYMAFSKEDGTCILELEVHNNVPSEQWKEFVGHLRDTSDKEYSLVMEKTDGGCLVKLISFEDIFQIIMTVETFSSSTTIYLNFVKNESLFKAFEDLSLVLHDDYRGGY